MDQETKKSEDLTPEELQRIEALTDALEREAFAAASQKLASRPIKVEEVIPVGLSVAASEAMGFGIRKLATDSTKCLFLASTIHASNPELIEKAKVEIIETLNKLAERGWLKGTLCPLSTMEIFCYETPFDFGKALRGEEQLPAIIDTAVFAFVHVPKEVYEQAFEEFKAVEEGQAGIHLKE